MIGRLFLAIKGETLAFSNADAIHLMLVAATNMTELQVAHSIRQRLIAACPPTPPPSLQIIVARGDARLTHVANPPISARLESSTFSPLNVEFPKGFCPADSTNL
ncbi:hypothetical protein [Massilia sp. DWR3-1-1]|uniref:hypothetical protein n=1 Tax=Massilia sp. DWR3-1-1 TaxID=2804559 RepID=UPI003CF28268